MEKRNRIISSRYDAKLEETVSLMKREEREILASPLVQKVNSTFNDSLDLLKQGRLDLSHPISLGLPSIYLRSAGVPNVNLIVRGKTLNQKSSNPRHSYDLDDIKNLVLEIQRPWAIFRYGDANKALNLIIGLEKNDKQFLVGLSLIPHVKDKYIEINSVRNVFPRDNIEWLRWIQQGKAIRIDEKAKIQAIITKHGMNHRAFNNIDLNLIAKIVKNFVNPTFEAIKYTLDEQIVFDPSPATKVINEVLGIDGYVIIDDPQSLTYFDEAIKSSKHISVQLEKALPDSECKRIGCPVKSATVLVECDNVKERFLIAPGLKKQEEFQQLREDGKPLPDVFHHAKHSIRKTISNTTMEYTPTPLDLDNVGLTAIEEELVRMVAERSHQAWYAQRLREGVTPQDNPLMKSWSELFYTEKSSSLDYAEQAVKAAKAKFGPLEEFSSGRSAIQPEAFIDAIAENAHEVWARQRMDAGWTYGEVRDNDAKKHPMLIPYSELPEKEKEYYKDYGRHVVSSLQTLSRRHYTIAEKDAYHMEDGRLVGQKGDDIFITGLKIKDIRRSDSTGLLVATYESPVLSRGGMWYALVEPETGAVVYDARLSPLDQSFETGDIVIRPYLKRSSVLVEDDRHIEFEKPNNENRLLVYDKNTGKHSTIHAASGTQIQINGETYFKITNDSNQEVQLVSPKGEFVLPEGFKEPISIVHVGEKPYVLASRLRMIYLLDIEKGIPVEKSMNMITDQYGQLSMTLTGAKVPGLGETLFYMTEKKITVSDSHLHPPIVHGDGVFNIITDKWKPFFSKDVSIQEAFGREGLFEDDGFTIVMGQTWNLNGKQYCIIYAEDGIQESVNLFSEDGKKIFPENLVTHRFNSTERNHDTIDLFTRITINGRDYLQTRHVLGQSPSGTDRVQFEIYDPETGELYMKSRNQVLADNTHTLGSVRIPLCNEEGVWQHVDLVVSNTGDLSFFNRADDKDIWLVTSPEKFNPSDAMNGVLLKDGYIIMHNQETGNLSIWSQDGKKCLVDHEKGQIVERRRFPIVGAKETYIRLNGIEIPLKRLVENRKAPKLAVADGKSERRKDISDQGSSTSIGNQTEIPVGFIKAVADDELRQDRNRPADPSRSPEKVYDSILYPDENEALGAIGTVGHAVRDENGDKVVVGIRYDEGTGKTICKREKVDDIKKKFGVNDAEDKRNVIIPVKVGDQIHELKVPKNLAEDLARGKSVTVSEIRINYDPFLGACALTKDYQKVHYYELSNSEKMKEARQQKAQAAKQSLSSPEPKKAFGGKKI